MNNTYQQLKVFLKNTGFPFVVEQNIQSFLESDQIFQQLCINLTLTYIQSSQNPDVLDLLMKEPCEFIALCEDFIYEIGLRILNERDDEDETFRSLHREQIQCLVRVDGLPIIDEFKFSFRDTHLKLGLTYMRGIVHQKMPVEKQLALKVFKCKNECFGSKRKVQRTTDGCREDFICKICHSEYSEVINMRVMCDVKYVEIFQYNEICHQLQRHKISFPMRLKLSGDLCDQHLDLGQELIVTGVFDPIEHLFNVWSLQN